MTGVVTTPWMSTTEAARYLGYESIQGVRDAIHRGELRAYRRGRSLFVNRDDADAFMRHRPVGPVPADRVNPNDKEANHDSEVGRPESQSDAKRETWAGPGSGRTGE